MLLPRGVERHRRGRAGGFPQLDGRELEQDGSRFQ